MRMVLDIFAQMLRALWAHKLRSFLTMFGIAWGVGSLLLLVGLGEGFRSGNKRQLETMGQDIIFIFPGTVPAVEGQHQGMKPYFLTYQDVLDIRKEAKLVKNVSPVLNRGDIRAQSDFATSNGQVIGVNANFNEIRYLPMGQGRWLNDLDDQQRRNIAVLGWQMTRNLFPGRPAVGSTILLNGVRFEIVGVLASVGRDENNSTNFRVYVPFNTMRVFFPMKNAQTPDDISFINLQPISREQHSAAREEVHRILGRNHGFDYRNKEAFEEWDTIESHEMVGKIFNAMDLFLGGVGLVTLALGAIGVINIMLVSVTERTREIGLMKALGATNRSILLQFFFEGAFLTLLSGGLGIGAAAGFMTLLHQLPSPPGFDPPTLVPMSAALAVLSLALAGIVAGLYPARKAAMLTPVEALRKE
ncbi:MAG TPA: ABC transporter permease [Candidatus Angelobacter sp.]